MNSSTRTDERVLALLYHDVIPDGDFESSGFPGAEAVRYKVDATEFARHLEALERATSWPPARIDRITEAGAESTLWLLTFDDGGASARAIGESLAARGWVGHFFITTDRIGTPSFLREADVRALAVTGHVIGSHSRSHPEPFSSLSFTELVREWRESVERLTDLIAAPVTTASLPGGFYSRDVARAAAVAGIRTLFTSEPRTRTATIDGCLVVGRYTIVRGMTAASVAALVSGRWAPRIRQAAAWNARKAAKWLGGPLYHRMRARILAASRK